MTTSYPSYQVPIPTDLPPVQHKRHVTSWLLPAGLALVLGAGIGTGATYYYQNQKVQEVHLAADQAISDSATLVAEVGNLVELVPEAINAASMQDYERLQQLGIQAQDYNEKITELATKFKNSVNKFKDLTDGKIG